jgi:flagellar assembly factor FliW
MAQSSPTTTPTPLPGLSVLHFPRGIPGFREARHFAVQQWGEGPSPFVVLDSLEVAGLRLVAVDPGVFFPWYKPAFGREVYEAIDVGPPPEGQDGEAEGQDGEAARVALLVTLTLSPKPEETTANLLGPLVVNPRTGTATQAVPSGPGYRAATPLLARG